MAADDETPGTSVFDKSVEKFAELDAKKWCKQKKSSKLEYLLELFIRQTNLCRIFETGSFFQKLVAHNIENFHVKIRFEN